MKVKEVSQTANVAWSPAQHHPIYLAGGTAAQQLDATFSTSAALDIYHFNLSEPGLGMECVSSLPTDSRFHKLVWGASTDPGTPSGLLMGGTDSGNVLVWDADKLVKSRSDPLIHKLDKHVGAVAALDINPFQKNLLASGASESEIYLWDLNNPTNPMTPGSKSQPADDVTCLAWNKQVQHILASTYSGRCVVWDLRKNEPIIKVSDSMTRIKCKLVAWHPETATQMCLASEDDHTPVIQIWDLRFATSPVRVLEKHTRGILSIAWCPQDPELLLSCGKDNRILCWNPNSTVQTGEVVYELPTTHQWSFDVQWCPRNPAVISSCSFDGHISVYSLMGGRMPAQSTPAASQIADSFMTDAFGQPTHQAVPPGPEHTESGSETVVLLKKPPKWLRRPCGAAFGFGGRLVTFGAAAAGGTQGGEASAGGAKVYVSEVVTEEALVNSSKQLQHALTHGQLMEFCAMKINANNNADIQASIWNFLKVNFEKDPRLRYLQLLGHDQTDLSKKISNLTAAVKTNDSSADTESKAQGIDASELAQKMAILDTGKPGSDGALSSSAAADFDQIASDDKEMAESNAPFPISVEDDCDGLVTQALLTANFEAAVDVCLHNQRLAEAVILAIAGGPELLARTQKTIFSKKSAGNLNRLIGAVVSKDFEHVIRTCELDSWREALALALTYGTTGDHFTGLCDILGQRLETEDGGRLAHNACLCYICAGNVNKLVQCCNNMNKTGSSASHLQDLVEKAMVLKRAVELSSSSRGTSMDDPADGYALNNLLNQYAELLASQGRLEAATSYLQDSSQGSLAMFGDRLRCALGQTAASQTQKPFKVINVQGERPQATASSSSAMYAGQNQTQGQGQGQGQQYAAPATARQGAAPATGNTGVLAASYGTGNTGAYNQYTSHTPSSQASGYPTAVSQPHMYDPTAAVQQQIPGGPFAPMPSHVGAGASRLSAGNIYDPTAVQPAANRAATAAESNVPSYQETKPVRAWNDPPPVTVKAKTTTPRQPEVPVSVYQPITQPIQGVPQPVPGPGAVTGSDQGPPGGPSVYTPQARHATSNAQPPNVYNPQQYAQQQKPAARAPEPPKPVKQLKPIPDEHKILQDVLQSLVTQCLSKASNPQMKRKLDDVTKKLESLYERLREQTLSGPVLLGLHQIIQAIQQYEYSTGLAYHTQMISQGNFSEISAFMPGIKVLLQTAATLQIYVQ